jgi:diguanylate cyclase (GGDEF)-like protein
MSSHRPSTDDAAVQDEGDLTQSLRRLVISDDDLLPTDTTLPTAMTALLFCRDASARKWGPRWLTQFGFETILREDISNIADHLRTSDADIIIVEASFRDEDGAPLYASLIDAVDVSAPVLVLCSGAKEVTAALDAGAFDVIRKPYEWRLIAARTKRAVQAHLMNRELDNAKVAASQAIDLADSARQRLRSRESFEPLTGLPNKSRFVDLIKRGMNAVSRDGNVLAVFVIGFARFRLVIEAMGQERADLLLSEIGYKLNACLKAPRSQAEDARGLWTAAAASLDGPRFGVMLTCSNHGNDLADMQQRLLSTLTQPVQVASQIVHLSACMGVAMYPQDADEAGRLLQRAENAMREAQSHGGGFRHYCEQSDAAAARKLRMEHMLHEALDNDELYIAYQPISETASGKLVGAEALLRWPQSDGSYISPNDFAPIAEESGLMIRLGRYVLDGACRQFSEWNTDGARLARMCVNVSKVQLMSDDFVSTVAEVLERYQMEAASLELEISERGVVSGAHEVINQLQGLRELGVRLSIDDFGTGDSAINYLKELPVDCLKIDRSYIGGMIDDKKDGAIVSAMVTLGKHMDLVVIAEGVETEQQLRMLRDLDCELFQGFIVSRPVPADKFLFFLNK